MDKPDQLKAKVVGQGLEFAKTCIHKQLTIEEFIKLLKELENFYVTTKVS
jgi:hypothetical protein